MSGETNLNILLQTMQPKLQDGSYVFCTVDDVQKVDLKDVLLLFREEEAVTLIVRQEVADALGIQYEFVAAWITLTVHSSLSAVGLTAAFANALAEHSISCNVVAAYYHDHIFVDTKDAGNAMEALYKLAKNNGIN
jgi:uncharacterized protein